MFSVHADLLQASMVASLPVHWTLSIVISSGILDVSKATPPDKALDGLE